MFYANQLSAAANTADTKSLPQCLPHRCCHHACVGFYDPPGYATGKMFQRNHPERHVLVARMRLEWCFDRRWRAFGGDVDIDSRIIYELADLLGYRSWTEIFLRFTGFGLGHTSSALHSHHGGHRSLFPLRQCVSRQSRKLYGEFLGKTYSTVSEWLNVAGLALLCFMLISYLLLPTQQTRSHYLSVCLIVAVIMLALGFTIPLATQPEKCFNEITPNDMYSSLECAWSGALIVAGGLSAVMWILIRALSMNLQICWDIVPGRRFFYVSQALGWGIPAVLFTAIMVVTGVSFRFGSACHVNHENSMANFWGPLLGMAALAGILQLMTFGYCINVYLKNLWTEQSAHSSTNASSTGLPSYSNSIRTQTARAVWRRLQKVLWLQWRGICIVTIILFDVVFFSTIFVYLDRMQASVQHDYTMVYPWLYCLVLNNGNKNDCLPSIGSWLVSEGMVTAVLILLSLAGVQVFVFLARPSIFPAWGTFIRSKLPRRQAEFISLDAAGSQTRATSDRGLVNYDPVHDRQDTTTFEMQKPEKPRGLSIHFEDFNMKTPFSPSETIMSSPDESYKSNLTRSPYVDSPPNHHSMSPSKDYPSMNIRGRIPSEYLGNITPDTVSAPSPALNRQSSAPHPYPTPGTDYFTHHRTVYPRPSSDRDASSPPLSTVQRSHVPQNRSIQTSANGRPSTTISRPGSQDESRHYVTPYTSFSAPKNPSRTGSMRSTIEESRIQQYTRGGLGLNPPSEAGESREDIPTERPRRRTGAVEEEIRPRWWGEGGSS
nr:hypothetical protein CFP56_52234 [Quercus suber]